MQPVRLFSAAPHRTAAIMCGVFFAGGLTIASIGPSLPVLAARSGVDVAALGGLFTAFSAGVMIAQLGVARASRRFGQRATLAVSMLLTCAGCLVIAQGIGLLAVFGAALVGGVGVCVVRSLGPTLAA